MNEKAILAVSFGTSHPDTRKVTIDAIEARIKKEFPEYPFYSAWTSKRIIKKLLERDGIRINTVTEACERMLADGVREVVVQPTHILNGYEYDLLVKEVRHFKHKFEKIVFSKPLISGQDDIEKIIELFGNEFSYLEEGEALVLMGHGTEHFANTAYAALEYAFKDKGLKNVFVGCVEGYPDINCVRKLLKEYGPSKVFVTPLLIVAGEHAKNDMAGEEEGSWKNLLRSDGYEVECIVRGLGEYEAVRDLFAEHLKAAMNS